MNDLKQYNIIGAKQASLPPDSHGNLAFWIEIEGEGHDIISALCSRKPTSPQLGGPTWGILEDKVSKAGKPYKRFKVQSAPETNGQTLSGGIPLQQPVKLPGITETASTVAAPSAQSSVERITAAIEHAGEVVSAAWDKSAEHMLNIPQTDAKELELSAWYTIRCKFFDSVLIYAQKELNSR